MTEGVRAKFGTDLGVSTTGFAGPGGGTDANPVGTAYVGRAHAGGCEVVRWGLDRHAVRNHESHREARAERRDARSRRFL